MLVHIFGGTSFPVCSTYALKRLNEVKNNKKFKKTLRRVFMWMVH